MPEVAEVAITADYLNHILVGDTITDFKIVNGRYTKKIPEGYDEFIKDLPLKIERISSTGKFFWMIVSNKDKTWYIWNTFGMSGGWTARSVKKPNWTLITENNLVNYVDHRNFGTIKFSTDHEAWNDKIKGLKPDLLRDDDYDMVEIMRYKKPIVAILMDQTKGGSGIGNYLVAEILYRAKISPYRLGTELTGEDVTNLVYWTKYMTKYAYQKNIKYFNMPNIYHPNIILDTTSFRYLVYRQQFDPYGNQVIGSKIIPSRTTWWVPEIQK